MQHQRWGKTYSDEPYWKPLIHHGLDVAAVLDVCLKNNHTLLEEFAKDFALPQGDVSAMLLTLFSLHDIGKVAASFQALAPEIANALGIKTTDCARYTKDYRHDLIGYCLLLHLMHEGKVKIPRESPERAGNGMRTLLSITCGHHGVPPAGSWREGYRDISARRYIFKENDLPAAIELVETITKLFNWKSGVPALAGVQRHSYTLNGLITLCDWLGSSAAFTCADPDLPPEDYWAAYALPNAKKVVDEIQPAILRSLPPQAPRSFARLFAHLAPAGVAAPTPTDLQAQIDQLFTDTAVLKEKGPLLVVIEDLPGSGKTEAGDLIAQRLIAHGWAHGLYVGLPTMATADAAFSRKLPPGVGQGVGQGQEQFPDALFAAPCQTVLAHSRRHNRPNFQTRATRHDLGQDGGHVLDWFTRSSRRALLADLGVGTVDQALAGVLRARYATLRLLGLRHKVLIIDEVHAYDDYMQELLVALLRHQGRVGDPVVLMSATLPGAIKDRLIAAYAAGAGWNRVSLETMPALRAANDQFSAYPLLTVAQAGTVTPYPVQAVAGPGLRPIRLEAVHTPEAVAEHIQTWLAAGRSVIWFRNTVGEAQKSWHDWCARAAAAGWPEPLLYHARFVPGDRAEAEKRLLAATGKESAPEHRRARLIIATQAAEQSLDIDCDELVSDLAPVDVLCQRLGRRRRHARSASGERLRAAAVDRRPESFALLHTPPLAEPVPPDWFARFSRAGAYIYTNAVQLWLTACLLTDVRVRPEDGLVIARDIRRLLETVYADLDAAPPGAPEVPPALRPSAEKAAGEQAGVAQHARQDVLSCCTSLLEDWNSTTVSADADGLPRTRLGENYRIILAVVNEAGNAVRLLAEHTAGAEIGTEALEASECSYPRDLRHPDAESDWRKILIQRLPATHCDALAERAILFLSADGADGWQGRGEERRPAFGTDKDTKTVSVTYHRHCGLVVGAC